MKYQWPEENKQIVNCPNCSNTCECDLELVKELSLPLRPAYCVYCNAEFELNHDGIIKLIFAHPTERNPDADTITRKVSDMVFNPR